MKHSILETDRIASLDVIRGFALLGILFVNILSFGAVSAIAYNPTYGLETTYDIMIWVLVEIIAEGAMRAMFSILFGAGIVMFLSKGNDRKKLHFKRTFWLLIFGLINGYILMWPGDILFTYALAGFGLYFLSEKSPKTLALISVILFLSLCAYTVTLNIGLDYLRQMGIYDQSAAKEWSQFYELFAPSEAFVQKELAMRKGSFLDLFTWSAAAYSSVILELIPTLLFWDVIVFMCIGMALYKYNVLQGRLSKRFYFTCALIAFALGISINAYEVNQMIASEFDILVSFSYFTPTYQIGRLCISFGWIGVLILAIMYFGVGRTLAAVGRMALTNYLMQSIICLFLFTGVGFGLLNELRRSELYLVVLCICIFQLWVSSWWLSRFYYGPLEWLWRSLTYGKFQKFYREF